MFSGRLNLLLAHERQLDLRRAAKDHGRPDPASTPVTRVTLRYSSAADREPLRRLAQLDSGRIPRGASLVAEVDGRLRAALPLDGSPAIADPFHRGLELVELLQVRALQLARD
ncbi:MAG TPA: hypothetical protein VGH24_11725 [Solirubrobacteraceae bacterium]